MDTPSAGERLALTSSKKPQSSAFLLQFIQTRLGLIYYRCTKYETMIAVCGWIFPHPIQHPIQPRHLPANSGAKLPNIVTAPPPLAPSHNVSNNPKPLPSLPPTSLYIPKPYKPQLATTMASQRAAQIAGHLNYPRGLLAGQVAIITGSGQGIGAEAARLFANEGARVVVQDIDAGTHTVEPLQAPSSLFMKSPAL